jgi:hypothetical protein
MILSLLVILAVAVCVLLYESRFGNLVKGLLVALIFTLVSLLWLQHQSLLGWSSKSALADGAQVLYAASREPQGEDPGAIYYMIAEDCEPRLHQLPYSEMGAQEAQDVASQLKNGGTVMVNSKKDGVPSEYDHTVVGFVMEAPVELPQK